MSRFGVLGVLLVAAACSSSPPAESASTSLMVAAAASLQDAFEEIASAYEEETGVEIALSFEASSTLRTQISEGAPVDLFASADRSNPEQLAEAGLTQGDPTVFAGNGLAIVVPADGSGGVGAWQALGEPGTRVIAAGEDVPITAYAAELVDALATQRDAPADFEATYEENIVSREDNVRAVLAKLEVGEGDAGVVYETDAASSDDVTSVDFPPEANVVAQYAFVILEDADPATQAFADWLTDADGQAILERFGFRPASA